MLVMPRKSNEAACHRGHLFRRALYKFKANHFLSDNFHGAVVIVTESVENPTATHVHRKTYIITARDHQVNYYDCYGKGGFLRTP